MRKETIITAIVFLGVGFLGGYIFASHRSSQAPASVAAVAAAQEQQELPPGHPPVSSAMGGASQGAQQLPPGHPPINANSMIQALEAAAKQEPGNPQPPLRLADLLYDQKRFQEAVPWFEKALKLDPKNVGARTDLGTVYFNLGQPRKALSEYRRSLALQPDHQPTLFNTIIVNLEGTHDVAAARAAWERLHRLNPGYPGLDSLKQQLDSSGGTGSAKP